MVSRIGLICNISINSSAPLGLTMRSTTLLDFIHQNHYAFPFAEFTFSSLKFFTAKLQFLYAKEGKGASLRSIVLRIHISTFRHCTKHVTAEGKLIEKNSQILSIHSAQQVLNE